MELNNVTESKNIIEDVKKGSIGEELELEIGEILLNINGEEVKDIIDYKYLISDEYIVMDIQKNNGEIWQYEIEKEIDEDLGIVFTNPLIDKAKSCRNKCIFCFIDQLPENMRDTLYFKDDDSRLSFLQGNFITLTNMSDEEIDRIIEYKLSPINISVHTTNPELRCEMLNNKNAGKLYDILKRFHKAGLDVNAQIVLVPDINDGEELERTLKDLSALYPTVKSVAVVPIGITKYREGLKKVRIFDKDMAAQVIDQVKAYQENFLESLGTRFIFLSDEFYAQSKRDTPEYEEYEGFPQLENGVGLMKLFETEVYEEIQSMDKDEKNDKKIIIATGKLAYDFMNNIANNLMKNIEDLDIRVVPIKNHFFGQTITVAGLITGQDLVKQLKDLDGDIVMIPQSMLKADEDIFLDSMSLKQVEEKLGKEIIVSEVDGTEFVNKFKDGVD